MNIQLRKLGAVLVMAVLTAAGCGGSSGGDSVSPPPPPPPSGGIIRTGVAVGAGPITGFGSVIVNGVTYNTDGATFTRDGSPAFQADFAVGETVIVKGTIDDDNTNAVAESVELDEIVKGPVSSVDANGNITVLGQTVVIGMRASVDDSCPASLNDPTIAAVEVYGSVIPGVDGNPDSIDASRIECKTAGEVDEFEINGVVSSHNVGGAMTFMINGLKVDYSTALSIDNFPGGAINDGDPIEAKGTVFDDSVDPPVLTATRVEFKGNVLDGNEGDHFEIEGFITDFNDSTDFSVRVGSFVLKVTTTGSTDYEGGSEMDLGDNLKVEIEGDVDDVSGVDVLVATKIEIETSTNVRVVGLVDADVPAGGTTFKVLDVTINTDSLETRIEDKSDAGVPSLKVDMLRMGDYVEVRGQELPTGQITAFIIERDDFDPNSDDTELRGFVETGGVNEPNSLTVLGVTILTSEAKFIDSRGSTEVEFSTPAEFWAAVGVGSLVDAKGVESNIQELTATEVELEME